MVIGEVESNERDWQQYSLAEAQVFNIPNAAIVLIKVIVILRLTSPLNNKVQKLLEFPPGEQPSVKRPRRRLILSNKSHPIKYDAYSI